MAVRPSKQLAKMFILVTYKDGEAHSYKADEMDTFTGKDKALGYVLTNYISPSSTRRLRRAFEVDEAANVTEYRLVYRGGIMQFEREDAEEPPAPVKVDDDFFLPESAKEEF